jgi:hypothetical protein
VFPLIQTSSSLLPLTCCTAATSGLTGRQRRPSRRLIYILGRGPRNGFSVEHPAKGLRRDEDG